jgi:3-oxoacyl-[acyl-carrier protein] reductase
MSTQPVPDTFLVTGTSRGIGEHLAKHYATKGHRVFGCSRSPVGWTYDSYTHFEIDVSDERAVKSMLGQIRRSAGRLDVLINNAAINPVIAPALLMSARTMMKTMEVNFLGMFLICREAAKIMAQHKFGRIINMGSMAAYHQVGGETAYTASKAAVTAFSRVFAKEVYPLGITCNVLAPAAIPTELSAAIAAEALQDVLKRNAIPAVGELADVSNATDWLIRPESKAVTGQVIYLGGV